MFAFACFFLLQGRKPAVAPRQLTWMEVAALPAKPARKQQESNRNKIVQSDAGEIAKEAAPDAFLGEKTRVVDRQTVNEKKLTQMGHKATPAKSLTRPADPKAAQDRPRGPRAKGGDATRALSKFGLAILPDARRAGSAADAAKDTPQWANIGSQPQDYVQGIKESDRTALNTREYLFFAYHQRIRQRLELEWTRLLRDTLLRFYKSGRQLASDTEYTTKLMVILNERGEITKVKVLSVSGTQELDEVAVQAFNRAGPFPNPPRGLVKHGEIEVPWEMKLRS